MNEITVLWSHKSFKMNLFHVRRAMGYSAPKQIKKIQVTALVQPGKLSYSQYSSALMLLKEYYMFSRVLKIVFFTLTTSFLI